MDSELLRNMRSRSWKYLGKFSNFGVTASNFVKSDFFARNDTKISSCDINHLISGFSCIMITSYLYAGKT